MNVWGEPSVIERIRPPAAILRGAELPSRSGRAGLPVKGDDFDVVAGVPASSVAARWRTLLVHHLQRGVGAGEELAVSVAFLGSASFRARIRSGSFGSLHYCHLEGDARDSRIAGLAQPDSGRQLVVLQLSGTSRISADDQTVRLRPSEMLLVHQLDAIRMEDEGRVEQLLLVLQLDEAADRLPSRLWALRPDGALSTLAFRWMRDSCLAADALPSRVAGDIAHVLSGLLAQALTMQSAPTDGRHVSGCINIQAIEEYIEHRLTDPLLSPSRIAQALSCSVRTLHRAFSRPGTLSLGRYLWRRRVEACAEMLRAPAAASRTLTDIALDLGFTSSAHFSTMFREVFGVTPSEYRRGIQRASSDGVEVELALAA